VRSEAFIERDEVFLTLKTGDEVNALAVEAMAAMRNAVVFMLDVLRGGL
jgi:hypothetical protein